MAKNVISPGKNLKNIINPNTPLTSPGIINPIETKRITSLNKDLEERCGFFIPSTPKSNSGVHRATFYIEKTTVLNHLFKTSIASRTTRVIGFWIWLIKDGTNFKLILSRASNTMSESMIPELNLRYQLLSPSVDGITENSISDNNIAWKNEKVNEGLFGGIKGFFMGKIALTNFLSLNAADTNGIQFELFQYPDNTPNLLISRVSNSKRTLSLIGSTTEFARKIDDGEGMSGSRPCPPFSN
jgi:hypothetical protein